MKEDNTLPKAMFLPDGIRKEAFNEFILMKKVEMENRGRTNMYQSYFDNLVNNKCPLIKVNHSDLFMCPAPMPNEKGHIGFQCNNYAQAGELIGIIEIKCKFDFPDDFKLALGLQDENFNKLLDSMEFIKVGKKLPRGHGGI